MDEPRAAGSHADRWLSIFAAIGAICAVAISLYQAQLAREQQRASAWPYIAQSNSYVPGKPYTRQVENVGVGPARVRSFEVRVDGKPVRNWYAAVTALTGREEPGLVYSSFGRGSVLPPGARTVLLELRDEPVAGAFSSAAQSRLETIVCYCSIYDECWLDGPADGEPVSVPACPAADPAVFGG